MAGRAATAARRAGGARGARPGTGVFARARRRSIHRRQIMKEARMPRAAEKVAERRVAAAKEQPFNWEDPLDLEGELTEEERMVRDTAHHYAQDKLFPQVIMAFRQERFDRAIIGEMGALGLLGPTIPE